MNPMVRTNSFRGKAALAALIAVLVIWAYVWPGAAASSGPAGSSLKIMPAFHNFGDVIPTLPTDPVLFTLSNSGNGELNVHGIFLSDQENFILSMEGGPAPCGSTGPVIAPGGFCTFTVVYLPQQEGFFNATLAISSNDPARAELHIYLTGSATICGC